MARVEKRYRVVSHYMDGTTESSNPKKTIEECEAYMDENEQSLDKFHIHKTERPVSYTIRAYYAPTKED